MESWSSKQERRKCSIVSTQGRRPLDARKYSGRQDKGPITQIQIGVACNGARSDAVGKLDPGSRAIHALNPSKACQCETVFQVAFCCLTSAILITICTLFLSETWRRKDVADTVAPHAHLETLTKTQPTEVPEETQADSCPHTLTVASFLGRMRPTILTIEKPSGRAFRVERLDDTRVSAGTCNTKWQGVAPYPTATRTSSLVAVNTPFQE